MAMHQLRPILHVINTKVKKVNVELVKTAEKGD